MSPPEGGGIEAVALHSQGGHAAQNVRLGPPSRSPKKGANPKRMHLRLRTQPARDRQGLHGTMAGPCRARCRLGEERARRDCQLQRRRDSALTRCENL
jgi:hypothetical protein